MFFKRASTKACFFLVCFFLGVLTTSCKKPEPPKPPLVETVAVLPFDNETNNLNAPDILQSLVVAALKPTVYRVSDLQATNSFLEKVGIIDGGQLAALDPMKLGKDLGVQALVYGYVETFGYLNVGVYFQKKVVLNLSMIDVNTGQKIWENQGTGITMKFGLNKDQISQNLAEGLAEAAIEKGLKNPLEVESKQAVVKALSNLPGYQYAGFAEEPGSSKPGAKAAENILKSLIHK